MTRIKVSTIVLLSAWLWQVKAQDSNTSYVLASMAITPTDNIVQIDYTDGLGRPCETVMSGFTPQRQDLVILQEYDGKGRETNAWAPVPFTATGNFVAFGTYKQTSGVFWGDSYAYVRNVYESTPLDRLVAHYGNGADWHLTGHSAKKEYQTSGNGLLCANYVVSSTGKNATLAMQGYLAGGKLQVEKSISEDGIVELTFKDMFGNVRLQRTLSGNGEFNTYYVYDALGRLRFVLPPEASKSLTANYTNWTYSNSYISKYGYYYEYDSRDLCTLKKLPGCDPVKMVYDKVGHLVFSQDGNQSLSGQWTFFLYDIEGRLVVQGICVSADIPSVDYTTVIATWTSNGMYDGYDANITLQQAKPLLTYYYDNYDFIESATTTERSVLSFSSHRGYPLATANVKSLLTGLRVHQLQATSLSTVEARYYDGKGHVISTCATNSTNGSETVYISYRLSGAIEKRYHQHIKNLAKANTAVTEEYSFEYDHSDRLLSEKYSINGSVQQTLASYTYDEIGRMKTKTIGSTETQFYSYNVRSWPEQINGNRFKETLCYNTTVDGLSPSTKQYGGNISAMRWFVNSENKWRGFQFSYDDQSRLTTAAYGEGTGLNSNQNRYSESFRYDNMGNVESLTRYGLCDNNTYGMIDNLTYTYNGNQVVKVDDSVSGPAYTGAFHFVDGSSESIEYEYDKNGNMTKDLNKKLAEIQYNLLNLPSMINCSPIYYQMMYDAAGNKLTTMSNSRGIWFGQLDTITKPIIGPIVDPILHSLGTKVPIDDKPIEVSKLVDTYQYCGNVIYHNDTKIVRNSQGYATFDSSGNPEFHYYLCDHQGNVRVVFSQDGTIEQVNHYYAFGGLMGESTGGDKQRFKYNGKELDRMGGINWYDYGARYHDAMRFTTIDPMAEKYYSISPYAHCANNPVNAIDINGDSIFVDYEYQDQLLCMINSISEGVFDVSEDGYLYLKSMTKQNREKTKSKFFRDMLISGINAKNKAIVSMTSGSVKFMNQTINLNEHGGGVTVSFENGMAYTYIQAESEDMQKNSIILAHELAGHAIPTIVFPSDIHSRFDGLAVTSENIIREEVGMPLRLIGQYEERDWAVKNMAKSLSIVYFRQMFPKIHF